MSRADRRACQSFGVLSMKERGSSGIVLEALSGSLYTQSVQYNQVQYQVEVQGQWVNLAYRISHI